MIGRTLSHYEILEKIGSGGMGDVYLAKDHKLDRNVALKILPAELAENPERRERFEREAKSLAALNHPHIVTVFSVEQIGGVHFITMELVRGKPLSELIPKSGFSLARFFEVAIPLADAVAAAHERGITHRDLKPPNVMLDENAGVKVLDFGLAKPETGLIGQGAPSELPTQAKTQEGAILGTVHYMSPEQAEGKAVDHRSDLFSLGILFYEMLTGRRPFEGETPASILSAILKDTPRPVTELQPPLPGEIGRIVRRCLAKDLQLRFQTALDIRNELTELRRDLDGGAAEGVFTDVRPSRKRVTIALTAALLAGVAGYVLRSSRVGPSQAAVPQLRNPVHVTFEAGLEDYPDWSPDGRTLAYHSNASGNFDIWVKQLGSAEALNRTADHPGVDQFATWSPDGSEIAFWSDREGGGYFVMSALVGVPRKVASATAQGRAQWSSDGKRLAHLVQGSDASVVLVSLQDGTSEPIPLETELRYPISLRWHPGGDVVAYLDTNGWDSTEHALRVTRLSDGTRFTVTEGAEVWSPFGDPDGEHLYYVSDRSGALDLWRQAVSKTGEPFGEPQPLTTGLGIRSATLSPNGDKLAYSTGRYISNLWRVPIRHDRPSGWQDAEQLTFEQARIEYIDVSPDGSLVLFDSDRSGNTDLWSLELESGQLRQLTRHPEPDWYSRRT